MEDMGSGDVPEPGPDEPELIEGATGEPPAPAPAAPEEPEGGSAEEPAHRSFKEAARETVAKAAGVAVELGSVLGGQGGEIVGAEREMVEAETEDFIDRVDGEDE